MVVFLHRLAPHTATAPFHRRDLRDRLDGGLYICDCLPGLDALEVRERGVWRAEDLGEFGVGAVEDDVEHVHLGDVRDLGKVLRKYGILRLVSDGGLVALERVPDYRILRLGDLGGIWNKRHTVERDK